MHVELVTRQHPAPEPTSGRVAAVLACLDCAATTVSCADACLVEGGSDLADCIRLNLDCAALCRATAEILGRGTSVDRPSIEALLRACAILAGATALECERHGESMAHCLTCAEACRECAAACRSLLHPQAEAK